MSSPLAEAFFFMDYLNSCYETPSKTMWTIVDTVPVLSTLSNLSNCPGLSTHF